MEWRSAGVTSVQLAYIVKQAADYDNWGDSRPVRDDPGFYISGLQEICLGLGLMKLIVSMSRGKCFHGRAELSQPICLRLLLFFIVGFRAGLWT